MKIKDHLDSFIKHYKWSECKYCNDTNETQIYLHIFNHNKGILIKLAIDLNGNGNHANQTALN